MLYMPASNTAAKYSAEGNNGKEKKEKKKEYSDILPDAT